MSYRWLAPTDLQEALETLAADDGAIMVGGGVSLVLFMNLGFLQPADLVSLAGLQELRGVNRTDTEIDIGAMETHATLAGHPAILQTYPGAATMFSGIGNIRVRNWGTLGGNLAHADPAQDPPVMLTALRASAEVAGPTGSRSVLVEDLAEGPLSPSIDEDEIITRVRIPVVPDRPLRTSYVKFRPGTQDDYATVSVAAALHLDDRGAVTQARLAAGSVGPTAIALDTASEWLTGQIPDPEVLRAVGDAVRDAVDPGSDRRGSADYKREMAGVMAQRAIRACLDGAASAPSTTSPGAAS